MSVVYERGALDRPVTLFEHARRLHRSAPDSPLPDGGQPFPDGGARQHVPYQERQVALAAVLQEYINSPSASPQDLHDRCADLVVRPRDVTRVLADVAPESTPRLRRAGRWLLRNGTNRPAVLVGLGLLIGNAEPVDTPTIKIVGLMCFADQLAIEALAAIPGAERDLIWLAERSRAHPRITAVTALAGHPDPGVRRWVRSTPRDILSSDLARKIAEQHDLPEMLTGAATDGHTWDQVGNLLLAMASTRNYQSEISRYEHASAVYHRWIALAQRQQATLERAAALAMVAEDLRTGAAAPVIGEPRNQLVEEICGVLSSMEWRGTLARTATTGDAVEARRAAWVIEQVTLGGVPPGRFAIRVVVPDPSPVGFPQVETRIVIDGMPAVAQAFDKGPAESPERLLTSDQLRATSEPREVRLAEAYCTEGCCGGLYVTIVSCARGRRSSGRTGVLLLRAIYRMKPGSTRPLTTGRSPGQRTTTAGSGPPERWLDSWMNGCAPSRPSWVSGIVHWGGAWHGCETTTPRG